MAEALAQPVDRNSNPIPVLSLRRSTGAHQIAIGSSSLRNGTAFAARVISVYATVDCFVELGGASVTSTATRHFIPKGMYIDLDLNDGTGDATHIAVIHPSNTGTLYVSERM